MTKNHFYVAIILFGALVGGIAGYWVCKITAEPVCDRVCCVDPDIIKMPAEEYVILKNRSDSLYRLKNRLGIIMKHHTCRVDTVYIKESSSCGHPGCRLDAFPVETSYVTPLRCDAVLENDTLETIEVDSLDIESDYLDSVAKWIWEPWVELDTFWFLEKSKHDHSSRLQ